VEAIFAKENEKFTPRSSKKLTSQAERLGARRYRLDKFSLRQNHLTAIETAINRKLDKFDNVQEQEANADRFLKAGGVQFPHLCSRCRSAGHVRSECFAEVKCVWPLCGDKDHDVAVCKLMSTRCAMCKGLGHTEDMHENWSTFELWALFHAGKFMNAKTSRLFDMGRGYKYEEIGSYGFIDTVPMADIEAILMRGPDVDAPPPIDEDVPDPGLNQGFLAQPEDPQGGGADDEEIEDLTPQEIDDFLMEEDA